MGADSLVGAVILAVIGLLGSVLVARVSNPGQKEDASVEAGGRTRDLTTIAGIAEVVAEQGREISALQKTQAEHEEHARFQDRTIQAFRRWAKVLETALRGTGAQVPEPEDADKPYIRG